ncbi:ABC transporter ATP-binding protein [Streptomyces rimosus]|uniref:ABC transporter ATP-binding protein n=1 Tax=Streptomyces rimosus TaxID=1927 RepID=UPI0037CECBC0
MTTSTTKNPAPSALPLDIRGLTHRISDRTLFDGLDLTIRGGETVAVTGPSGSGKSTLLSCVLGLLRPDAGELYVAGADMARLKKKALAAHRGATVGMVFQFGELLPELSPAENVALAALLAGAGPDTAQDRARALLAELGVPEADTTEELSGGERQRTAVARALINEPALILADEPTGALDAETRDHVAEVLFGMPRKHGCGLLVVTHDPVIAGRADRVLRLRDGALVPEPKAAPETAHESTADPAPAPAAAPADDAHGTAAR